jgi:hypothetical protein
MEGVRGVGNADMCEYAILLCCSSGPGGIRSPLVTQGNIPGKARVVRALEESLEAFGSDEHERSAVEIIVDI